MSDVQTFTTPGANTWTKPDGVSFVRVVLYGGGGAGGGGGQQTSSGGAGGVGGAGAAYVFSY
ncbi:MAG: hypothetical protein JNM91_02955 [Flavobacteriales bacterium]|nr:hypothetical protein [Flavobacteriales bacterium]